MRRFDGGNALQQRGERPRIPSPQDRHQRLATHPPGLADLAAGDELTQRLIAIPGPGGPGPVRRRNRRPRIRYVALGDSYSSGVGAGSYTSSSGSCDRSTNAYSQLWANVNHPASYTSAA